MGSGHSSAASAYTYIDTEVSSFCPGALVQGVVKILVEKPTHARQMSIFLTCFSESQWVEGSGENSSTYHDKRTLSQHEFPIWNFEGNLSQGQYALSFNILLPTDLIHSFKYEYHGTIGRVEYYFEAVVVGNNEVQAQKTVVWVNKLLNPGGVIMPVSSEASIKVNSCCCFQSGKTMLKSTINNNVAMINEDLIINSKIVNTKNRYTVTKITYNLIQSIRLKVKYSYGSHSTYISSVILTNCEYIGVKPGESEAAEISLGLGLKDKQDLWMFPTIESELVDCEYTVKVTLAFDNTCGCGTYSIMIPLEICNGMMVLSTKFSAPPQIKIAWNPMMLSPIPIQVQVPIQGQENNAQDIIEADTNLVKAVWQENESKVSHKEV
jgi:hypothetical protein